MNSLPEEMLINILECIPPKELFKEIILVSKTIQLVLHNHFTLKRIAQLITGCESEMCKEDSVLLSIIKKSLKKSSKKPLEFYGFGTTGGVDGSLSQYWVANLFSMDNSSYCSNIGPGFSCVAALKRTQKSTETPLQIKHRKIAAKIFRKNSLLCQIISADEKSKGPLLPLEEATILAVWDESPEFIIGSTVDYAQETIHKVIQTLRMTKLRLEKFKQNDENIMFQEIDHRIVNLFPIYACIKGVFINRRGDFSCPGKTFWVFCSDKYFEVNQQNFMLFEKAKTIEEVKVIAQNEKEVEIDQIIENEFFQACLFKRKSGLLKPIFWFRFVSDKADEAKLNLRQFFSAKYLYVSFCDFQNRMIEMNDHHPNPNIDFTYIVPFGFEFSTE